MRHNHNGGDRHALLDYRSKFVQKSSLSCALVLAGGEGKRLRPFVHLLRGDLLPKQYVNFIGRRSMLEHTLERAEKLAAPDRVFTIINKSHLRFPEVKRQLKSRAAGTVVTQPENKETAPGILLPLLHIAKRYPNTVVTVLPSDHFILEEEELLRHLNWAQLLVKREPSRVVLLGINPDREESEYGHIVLGGKLRSSPNPLFQISSFVEKPDYEAAQNLTRSGALWNTMMMVFKTSVMMQLIRDLSPTLFDLFQPVYDAIGTAGEEAAVAAAYRDLPSINFSKEILERMARGNVAKLVALPVRNVLWSDWGSENRVMEVLRRTGYASRLNGLAKAPLALPSAEARQFEPPFDREASAQRSKRKTTGNHQAAAEFAVSGSKWG